MRIIKGGRIMVNWVLVQAKVIFMSSKKIFKYLFFRLSGGAGPGGADSVLIQLWLMRFGADIGELWLIVRDLVERLGN